jgi:hypothetical protein
MTVVGYTISSAFGALVMADVTWVRCGRQGETFGHLSPRTCKHCCRVRCERV